MASFCRYGCGFPRCEIPCCNNAYGKGTGCVNCYISILTVVQPENNDIE